MQEQIEKLKLYVRIKWWVLAATAALIGTEALMGIVGWVAAASTFTALTIAALVNFWLSFSLRKIKFPALGPYSVLFFDLLLIILALYFNGGPENTWLFFPAILIFFSGYLFTLKASLIYGGASFLALLIMFLLEYFKVIPHFAIYGLPELYWRNVDYYADYLVGMFLLYFAAAIISGYFNQLMRQNSENLRRTLSETASAKEEAERSQRALLKLTEDLSQARDELELRVRERTAELETARADLEKKVAERTVNLENSRKAILHMMKELKEDMEKLKVIDRMKTEFLSMVSHELRTPLTPIMGYLSLLSEGNMGALTEKQKKSLEIISRQSKHLHTLIDSMLDLSHIELGRPIPVYKEPVSIKMIIEEVAEALRIQAEGKGLKIFTDFQEELPTIMGDATKLKRVVTNLLGNAIKFTPHGGEIKIRALVEDSNVRVEVIDNGLGIAREHLEKIFEKFYQVDSSITRAAGGMGMGLPIARELVGLHGGQLWAESPGLGKGSKFIFTIPIGGG